MTEGSKTISFLNIQENEFGIKIKLTAILHI
jgi:hypothetical protein